MAGFGAIVTALAVIIGLFSTSSVAKLDGLFISTEPLPWEEAREACLQMGKVLISIHSEAYDRSLVETLNGAEVPGKLWTSGHELSEGVWIWNSTGEPFYHTRWFVGQPDAKNQTNCFYMANTAQYYWRDADCAAPMYYVCEDLALARL